MYFAKWMTFLTSIICAIYGMSPSEINFDSFTGGNTSALSGSDTAEKLAASKDSGLRPLLAYFENLFTDYIAQEFSDKYVFRWTGLDPVDEQRMLEVRRSVLTLNEMRAEEGYQAIDGPIGDAPLNPSLIGVWLQMQQQADGGQGGSDDEGDESFDGGFDDGGVAEPRKGSGGTKGLAVGKQGQELPDGDLDEKSVMALLEQHAKNRGQVVKSFPVYVIE